MSTTLAGLGFAPLGMAPCGLGSPASSDALTAAIGAYGALSSIAIDPLSRDYLLDVNGQEYAMGSSAQRVWMCLATLKGSRRNALQWGLGAPSHITESIVNDTREAVRLALLPCTSDGSVELIDVVVETDPVRPTVLYAGVTWRDRASTSPPVTFRQQLT
ncbi:MAG: hypothetical protein WC563_15765 [Brevundimonas sp.]